MSWGIVATVGAAVIGAGGQMAAANSASKASKRASDASVQASREQIEAAERQYERTRELFGGYLQDGDLADAWLRALYEGEASYSPGGSGGAAAQRQMSDEELRQQYGDLWGLWRSGDTHRGVRYNNFADYVIANGQSTMTEDQGAPGAGATTITRDQVLAQIEGTPMAQAAQEWLASRNELTEQGYTGEMDLADEEYADLTQVGDLNYAELSDLAQRAREGRLTVAESNLLQRLELEDDSYAAWLPTSEEAERRAIDLNFSRGGVTGAVGATRRGVGETTQDAAMERSLRYLTGRQEAYDPYYADVTGAEDTYWGDMGDATGARAEWRGATTATRAGRRANAYANRQTGMESNFDDYTGDYTAAYNDFMGNNLLRRSNRGAGSRDVISGAGARATETAVNAYGDRGQALANNALRQGQIQQETYGDISNIIGGALGSWSRRKTPTSSRSTDVSRDEYGWPTG